MKPTKTPHFHSTARAKPNHPIDTRARDPSDRCRSNARDESEMVQASVALHRCTTNPLGPLACMPFHITRAMLPPHYPFSLVSFPRFFLIHMSRTARATTSLSTAKHTGVKRPRNGVNGLMELESLSVPIRQQDGRPSVGGLSLPPKHKRARIQCTVSGCNRPAVPHNVDQCSHQCCAAHMRKQESHCHCCSDWKKPDPSERLCSHCAPACDSCGVDLCKECADEYGCKQCHSTTCGACDSGCECSNDGDTDQDQQPDSKTSNQCATLRWGLLNETCSI